MTPLPAYISSFSLGKERREIFPFIRVNEQNSFFTSEGASKKGVIFFRYAPSHFIPLTPPGRRKTTGAWRKKKERKLGKENTQTPNSLGESSGEIKLAGARRVAHPKI